FCHLFFPSYLHNLHLHSFPTRRSSDLSSPGTSETSTHATDPSIQKTRVNPSSLKIRNSIPLCSRRSPPWGSSSSDPSNICHISRSEEHTSELQSPCNLVCRLLLEKKKQ